MPPVYKMCLDSSFFCLQAKMIPPLHTHHIFFFFWFLCTLNFLCYRTHHCSVSSVPGSIPFLPPFYHRTRHHPPNPRRCPWGRDHGLLTQVEDLTSDSFVPSTWSLNYRSLISLCPQHVATLVSCRGRKRSTPETNSRLLPPAI